MRGSLFFLACFFPCTGFGAVLSPNAVETHFTYEAQFTSQKPASAEDLATEHSSYLFGYMQSIGLSKMYGVNHGTPGFGAPFWPPQFTIESDTSADGVRTIKYRAEGTLLLHKTVAEQFLSGREFDVFLPADLDNYFDANCATEDGIGKGDFWYFFDPYKKGCAMLMQAPLAARVRLQIASLATVREDLTADLDLLRGDNGNGDLFDIVTINGFDEKGKKSDYGRIAFDEINRWLDDQGFTKTILDHHKTRPIYRFEKDFQTPNGKTVHVRITRLAADTDLDGRVTFAKFFKNAIENADVVLYAGHSGPETELEASEVEKYAGPIEFNRSKHQLFYFDACSGYSYYLPMFEGRKDPGTFGALTYGLSSEFGYEHAMHKVFLSRLFDFKDDHPLWNDIMVDMERSLRGKTYLLNYNFY